MRLYFSISLDSLTIGSSPFGIELPYTSLLTVSILAYSGR